MATTSRDILINFKKDIDEQIDKLNQIKKLTESVEAQDADKYNDKYNVDLKGKDDDELIQKYETNHEQIKDMIEDKNKEIEEIQQQIDDLRNTKDKFVKDHSNEDEAFKHELTEYLDSIDFDSFDEIIIQKKRNINKLVKCANSIVDKIIAVEDDVYNNKQKELVSKQDNSYEKRKKELIDMKYNEYDIIDEKKSKQMQSQVQPKENVLEKFYDHIYSSLKGLNKKHADYVLKVVFDSDDYKGEFPLDKFRDVSEIKKGLYFISYDDKDKQNIYGGFIEKEVVGEHIDVEDSNSFVFSMQRDGVVKSTKYPIKPDCADSAFSSFDINNKEAELYIFGDDIHVYPPGVNLSYCLQNYYDYNEEKDALVDNGEENAFAVTRIIVVRVS
ncbi:TLDc domain-containing protein [Entamoeba marina]